MYFLNVSLTADFFSFDALPTFFFPVAVLSDDFVRLERVLVLLFRLEAPPRKSRTCPNDGTSIRECDTPNVFKCPKVLPLDLVASNAVIERQKVQANNRVVNDFIFNCFTQQLQTATLNFLLKR